MSRQRYRRPAPDTAALRMLIGAAARPDLPCTINQRNQGRELRRVTSAKQFEYLYAYYVRGLLMREIAAEQGVAVSSVCRGIERGRYKAERILDREGGSDEQ